VNPVQRDPQPWQYIFNRSVFSILAKIGCLTFGIALGAILLGVWLDNVFGTRPWIMVIFFAASVPVTTYAIYRAVQNTTHQILSTPKRNSEEETPSE
jgi:F0F1-type ATP synthase assembly protein I